MNILWRSKRILMLLYVCFRFSEVMDQMGCRAGFFHGYAWCSLRLCSCGLTTRMESLKMSPPHHHHHLGVNLDYLDFSGGIFDLFYEPVREKTNNLGSDQV